MNGKKRSNILLSLILLLSLLAGLTAGCSRGERANAEHAFSMASLDQMPPEVQNAPATVREAYQFAARNQDVLEHLPCYCGCGDMGHTSNYNCYVAGTGADGMPLYDNHALGCQICVDITHDAMHLLDEGKSVDEIYDYLDATDSRFGPPTPLQPAVDGQQ